MYVYLSIHLSIHLSMDLLMHLEWSLVFPILLWFKATRTTARRRSSDCACPSKVGYSRAMAGAARAWLIDYSGWYTWWFIPLTKWVITPIASWLSLLIPVISGVITHLVSGMSQHTGIYYSWNIWDDQNPRIGNLTFDSSAIIYGRIGNK